MALALNEAEDEILRGLAQVIAHGATEAFLTYPFIHDTALHFPETWCGDLRSVRDALRRLLRHAGLPEIRVRLQDVRDTIDVPLPQGVQFDHLLDDVAHFCVADIGPQRMVGPLGLQIARVWAAWSGFGSGTGGPYRDEQPNEQVEVTDAAASLIMVALGFGVIALTGSAEILSSEIGDGALIGRRWRLAQAGGLPVRLCTFALAVHLVVRGVDGDDLDAIRVAVGPDHHRLLMKEVARLRPDIAVLLDELGLPPSSHWPALRDADGASLVPDIEDDEDLLARDEVYRAELALPNRNRVVFSIPRTGTIMGTIVGCISGTGAAALLPILGAQGHALGLVGTSLVVIGTGLGHALGRQLRRLRCSDPGCEHVLRTEDAHCPGCGGFVADEIASADDRLAAEEAYETEQEHLTAGS